MVWFLCQFQQNHASLSLGHKNLNLNPPNLTLQIECVHNMVMTWLSDFCLDFHPRPHVTLYYVFLSNQMGIFEFLILWV
jgi:hypothetical protein